MANVRTQIAIDEYLEDVKQLILTFYNQLGLRASGRFADMRIENNTLTIIGYGRFLADGAGSIGGFNPIAILEWMRAKGITPRGSNTDEQAAWAIAKSIEESGTQIFRGKAGIPYDEITARVLKEKEDEMANAMTLDIFDTSGFKEIEFDG